MTPAMGYTQMKDSGIPWLGEYPAHWKCGKVKNAFFATKTIVGDEVDDYERLALTLNGVIKRSKTDAGGLQPEKFETYQILRENELVFKLIDLQNVATSRVGRSPYTGIVSPAYIILHERNERPTKYAEYYFLSMWMHQVFNQLGADGVRSNIGASALLNIPFLLPPESEQKAIANYLDTQCAKIDEIIAEAKASIEEYKQWKASVIHEAVTKGLDPDVEMKESGVEWIGQIPQHWHTNKLKYSATIMRGKFNHRPRNDPDYYDGAYPFVQTGDVARAQKFITTYSQTLNELGFSVSKEFPKGSICMTIAANVGDVAILDFDACFPDSVVGFVPSNNVERNHLYYIFKAMKQQLTRKAIISTQLNLNIDIIKEEFIPLPPIEEQRLIMSYLDAVCSQIGELISEKEALIFDLESYKKSLIYEVVTGKRRVPTQTETTVVAIHPAYQKALLMCRVLDLLGDDARGRIHVQKCIFAIECLLKMPFQTQYARYQHGPYDACITDYEALIGENEWFTVQSGSPVTYKKGAHFDAYLAEYMKVFAELDSKIKEIVEYLKPMKTAQAERVATLLAAWNDFILDGTADPTDQQIINEVMTNWTPNKANTQVSTWQTTLDKLKNSGFVPAGFGVHTIPKEAQEV